MRACSVEGCDKPRKGTGRNCSMHQARWDRTGTFEPGPNAIPREARFWARVSKTPGCWLWIGSLNNRGYGKLGKIYAHRLAWEIETGEPIPAGLVIDHKCFNRSCVNPAHLQIVTLTENNQNHRGPRRNNRAGYRGVSWSKAMNKWKARAEHGGQSETAYFTRIEDAAEAAAEMRNRLHTNNLIDRAAG